MYRYENRCDVVFLCVCCLLIGVIELFSAISCCSIAHKAFFHRVDVFFVVFCVDCTKPAWWLQLVFDSSWTFHAISFLLNAEIRALCQLRGFGIIKLSK